MELRLSAIKGIGGAPLYLIDRFEDGKSIYDIDFVFLDGVDRHPPGHGLKRIDHLTHKVYRGRMAFWGGFYQKLFNFRVIRYFDISGEYTGLTSRAMTVPDGKIRIPLNEEARQVGGQIEEFLLGPFLAKNFASTLSPWVVTLDALAPFRALFTRPEGDPEPRRNSWRATRSTAATCAPATCSARAPCRARSRSRAAR